jgi:hypothetical protein
MAQLVSSAGVNRAVAPAAARTGVFTAQERPWRGGAQPSAAMPRAARIRRQEAPPIW